MTTGAQLKAQGQADTLAAELAAHREWLDEAEAALYVLIERGRPFTSEDLRSMVEREPHHPNCWGALLSASRNRNEIAAIGFTIPTRASSRSRPIRVWQPLD